MKLMGLSAALVVIAAGVSPAQQEAGTALGLASARFYQAAGGNGGETVIEGFCRVPFGLLDPLIAGPEGFAVFRIVVLVRDTVGAVVWTRSWAQRVPARALGLRSGSVVEHFTFGGGSVPYRVQVTVTDSATGRVGSGEMVIAALPANPDASDLLLTTGIRAAPPDSAPRGGELRRGGVVIVGTDRPVLTPQHSQLGYYFEIYRAAAETVTVRLRVLGADGAPVVIAGTRRQLLPAGGGAVRGMVELAGLPPGAYQLEAVVGDSRASVVRNAPFGVAEFETEQPFGDVAEPGTDAFASLTEAQLDTLYLPLIYVMTSEEQGTYPTLALDGKRRWLRQFWAKRDPTPGAGRNEEQESFYARIAEANRRFREGGAAAIPGWRTDRGRIFIKYGPPDAIRRRPEFGSTNPYEVWKYTRAGSHKYVFMDQTKFGNYALIWTDDRREPSRPNWEALLGRAGVEDVKRF